MAAVGDAAGLAVPWEPGSGRWAPDAVPGFDCEASITGAFDIIVNPDANQPVDTNPMFSGGSCTVDTY